MLISAPSTDPAFPKAPVVITKLTLPESVALPRPFIVAPTAQMFSDPTVTQLKLVMVPERLKPPPPVISVSEIAPVLVLNASAN